MVDTDHSYEDATVVADGVLTVDWMVDGKTDPARCAQGDAESIDIVVQTLSHRRIGEFVDDAGARDWPSAA
jgi:hypothetical protein